MKIEFYGKYKRKPYFRAVTLIHKPSSRSALLRVIFFVGFTAVFGAMLVSSLQTEGTSQISILIGQLITFTVVTTFTFRPYITAYTQARKDWSDPITHLPIQGIISEQGVTFNPGANQQVIEWGKITKKDQSEDFAALVADDETMVLLQRSFFHSEDEWQTVQEWIGQYVKPEH